MKTAGKCIVIGMRPKFAKICANSKRYENDGRNGTKGEEKYHSVTSKPCRRGR